MPTRKRRHPPAGQAGIRASTKRPIQNAEHACARTLGSLGSKDTPYVSGATSCVVCVPTVVVKTLLYTNPNRRPKF